MDWLGCLSLWGVMAAASGNAPQRRRRQQHQPIFFCFFKERMKGSAVAFGGSQLMESTCLMKSIDGAERKATSGAPSSPAARQAPQQTNNSFHPLNGIVVVLMEGGCFFL